jgi:hypothetical protein
LHHPHCTSLHLIAVPHRRTTLLSPSLKGAVIRSGGSMRSTPTRGGDGSSSGCRSTRRRRRTPR